MGARERLIKALGRRLETTPIDQIRVADLIEDADVGKQTFYRLYPDKFELLKDFYRESIIHEYYEENRTIQAMYRSTYDTLLWFREHKEITRNMFFSKDSFALKAYFRELCIESNGQIWARLGADMDDVRIQNALKIYSFGNASLLMDWFKSGMQGDLDVMTESYFTALPIGVFAKNNDNLIAILDSDRIQQVRESLEKPLLDESYER